MNAKGIYTLSNCGGLAIYDVLDEEVLVGLNDENPDWVGLNYDESGRAWFEWGGRVYLDECRSV